MTITHDTVLVRTINRGGVARNSAIAAAVFLLAGGTAALVADPAALADHTSGAGALSEALTGAAFVAGALTLAILTPVRGWRLLLWALAPPDSPSAA